MSFYDAMIFDLRASPRYCVLCSVAGTRLDISHFYASLLSIDNRFVNMWVEIKKDEKALDLLNLYVWFGWRFSFIAEVLSLEEGVLCYLSCPW